MISNIKTMIHILKELNCILDINQKKRSFFLLIILILSAGFELLGVTAVLPFVQAVISPEEIVKNKWIAKVIDLFKINNTNNVLILMGVFLIIVYLIKNAFLLYSNYVQYDFATRVQKELSTKMLQSYLSRPYIFFLDTNTSEILRGCTNDILCVYNVIDNLCSILSQILTVIAIGVFLIYADPIIALSILCLMSVVLIGIILFYKPAIKRAGQKNLNLTTLKNKILIQVTNGIKEIFVMQRKELFMAAYDETSDKARKVQRTYNVLCSSPDKIVEGVCISGIVGIICVRLLSGNAEMATFIPKLAAFAMAAFRILPSVGKIASRMTGIIYFRPGLEKVYQNVLEAQKYEIFDQNNKCLEQVENEKELLNVEKRFQNKLVVNHVFWQYEKEGKYVLKDISLTVKKGDSIALIGTSGSGKTTLSDIILGLLQPMKGTVELDGIDVYSMPRQWARIVGYVPQMIYLADDTIRNNIAFGMPEKTIDDNAIWEALENAQLKDYVEQLPQKLDTIVGERGVKLSGGQRQRIAIARALYGNPEILILDEATAALDNETETAVMRSIDALQGHITMIIVAHRLTTIRNCSKIYEIRDGEIIERRKEEILI